MRVDGGHLLLGRVLTQQVSGAPKRLIESEAEMVDVLENVFGIRLPVVTGLWQRVVVRHQQLFGDTPPSEIRFGPAPEE
jgi:hypothetical protein